MVTAVQAYHEAVRHGRGRLSGFGLDWTNQPSTFKTYPGLERFELPRDADLPGVSLWQALEGQVPARPFDAKALSAVLFHAAGLTRSAAHRGGEVFYRACPSAGALYPCELYLAWPGSVDIPSGLYHYDVARHSLSRLRSGFPDPGVLGLPERSSRPGEAIVFLTGIFYRSAWKYRARAYRYLNLDAGHVAEGLCLGLAAHGSPAWVEPDFDEKAVTELLGVDPGREGCLSVLRFVAGAAQALPPLGGIRPGLAEMSRVAASEPIPEELLAVRDACSAAPGRVAPAPAPGMTRLTSGLSWLDLSHLPLATPRKDLFTAMSSRASRRNFVPVPMHKGVLAAVLASLRAPLYGQGGHPAEHACQTGVLAGEETMLDAGYYMLDRMVPKLGLRRDGNIRPVMTRICLDQLWMGDASMHALFFLDFAELTTCLGDRGYRIALQDAGRLGHRLYLAAESFGIGACGVGAFYDDEASEVLGLPQGAGLAYVLPLGVVKG